MEEPLAVMVTTGPSYIDQDGCLVDSGEYVAALYETYQADREAIDTWSTFTLPDAHQSAHRYALTAQVAAEDAWVRDIEKLEM